jgi:hypothetical protein
MAGPETGGIFDRIRLVVEGGYSLMSRFRNIPLEHFKSNDILSPVVVVVLLLTLWTSCASVQKQTPLMQKRAPQVQVTSGELRVRVYEYLKVFTATVRSASDTIMAEEQDRRIRETALRWKINAISGMQSAVFHADPLAGFGNAWGLTIQMADFFETGAGKDLFGDSQELAMRESHWLEEEIFAIAKLISNPAAASNIRRQLEEWASENPLLDINFGRRSYMTEAAAVTAAELGVAGLSAVGRIEETARDLTDRLSIYSEHLPNETRWHAELVVLESQDEFVDKLLDDVASVDESIQKLERFFDESPNLIESERQFILAGLRDELGAALESIDRQRVQTLDVLSKERELILEALDDDLETIFATIQQERIQTITELEALTQKAVQDTFQDTKALVDHVFWKTLQLVFIIFALIAVAWAVRRLTARKTSS